VEDTSRLLEMKLKAANYEIDHLSADHKELTQQELHLKDMNQQKDVLIADLRRELQDLQERDQQTGRHLNDVCERNKELSETLQETSQALELLQNELFALKATLRDAPNNNQTDAEEEEQKEQRGVLPLIQSPPSRGSDLEAEPDEASQSYSADGYRNNVEKKSRETRSSQSDSENDGIGLKGLRTRIKKKKKKQEQPSDLILPSINQRRLGSDSVNSLIEASDCSGDEEKRKKRSAPRSSGAGSARSASAAYQLSHPVIDERQRQHRRLLEQREKSGGCSQCGKKIKGDPKKLPSSLKNIIVDGAGGGGSSQADSSPGGSSVISEAFFAGPHLSPPLLHLRDVLVGFPIVENHLDHQLAIRDKYSHPRGQHCIFCTWECAK
jgi:hypothetical protein